MDVGEEEHRVADGVLIAYLGDPIVVHCVRIEPFLSDLGAIV